MATSSIGTIVNAATTAVSDYVTTLLPVVIPVFIGLAFTLGLVFWLLRRRRAL